MPILVAYSVTSSPLIKNKYILVKKSNGIFVDSFIPLKTF